MDGPDRKLGGVLTFSSSISQKLFFKWSLDVTVNNGQHNEKKSRDIQVQSSNRILARADRSGRNDARSSIYSQRCHLYMPDFVVVYYSNS